MTGRKRNPLRTIAIVNFLLFVVAASLLGGDALNGGAHDGAYFVGMHGHVRRVSHGVWLYSLAHELLTFGLILSALARGLDRRERAAEAAEGDAAAR